MKIVAFDCLHNLSTEKLIELHNIFVKYRNGIDLPKEYDFLTNNYNYISFYIYHYKVITLIGQGLSQKEMDDRDIYNYLDIKYDAADIRLATLSALDLATAEKIKNHDIDFCNPFSDHDDKLDHIYDYSKLYIDMSKSSWKSLWENDLDVHTVTLPTINYTRPNLQSFTDSFINRVLMS